MGCPHIDWGCISVNLPILSLFRPIPPPIPSHAPQQIPVPGSCGLRTLQGTAVNRMDKDNTAWPCERHSLSLLFLSRCKKPAGEGGALDLGVAAVASPSSSSSMPPLPPPLPSSLRAAAAVGSCPGSKRSGGKSQRENTKKKQCHAIHSLRKSISHGRHSPATKEGFQQFHQHQLVGLLHFHDELHIFSARLALYGARQHGLQH